MAVVSTYMLFPRVTATRGGEPYILRFFVHTGVLIVKQRDTTCLKFNCLLMVDTYQNVFLLTSTREQRRFECSNLQVAKKVLTRRSRNSSKYVAPTIHNEQLHKYALRRIDVIELQVELQLLPQPSSLSFSLFLSRDVLTPLHTSTTLILSNLILDITTS